MITYSEIIKKIRKDKGLSLREFANLCDLSHSYIDKLEKGIDPRNGKEVSPTLDTIKQICIKTNYPLEKFLSETGYIENFDNPILLDKKNASSETKEGNLIYKKLVEIGFIKDGEKITEEHLKVLADVIAPQIDFVHFKLNKGE